MQILVVDNLAVRCLGPGPLLPWIGPALRGLVKEKWKKAVCRLSNEEQSQHEACSFGCPHHAACDYGRTMEPHAAGKPNQEGSRNIVFEAGFPAIAGPSTGHVSSIEGHPLSAVKGTTFPLTLILIGTAVASLETVLNWLTELLPTRGLGDEKAPLRCELMRSCLRTELHDLNSRHLLRSDSNNEETLARLRVEFTSPLILKTTHQQGRKFSKRCLNRRPHLEDLLSPCVNLIEELFAQADEPLNFDQVRLKRMADGKPPIKDSFRPFEQGKKCHKGTQNILAEGIVGHAVYADVPLALLPWLSWGGRLHVGNHRVAGAGGWRLILE